MQLSQDSQEAFPFLLFIVPLLQYSDRYLEIDNLIVNLLISAFVSLYLVYIRFRDS